MVNLSKNFSTEKRKLLQTLDYQNNKFFGQRKAKMSKEREFCWAADDRIEDGHLDIPLENKNRPQNKKVV